MRNIHALNEDMHEINTNHLTLHLSHQYKRNKIDFEFVCFYGQVANFIHADTNSFATNLQSTHMLLLLFGSTLCDFTCLFISGLVHLY